MLPICGDIWFNQKKRNIFSEIITEYHVEDNFLGSHFVTWATVQKEKI